MTSTRGADGARRIGVGIDFGTTNSVAATYDGERLRLAVLEPAHADGGKAGRLAAPHEADPGAVMPSATYIDRGLQTKTGREAIARYIDDNIGRKVELTPEVIGKATLSVGVAGADSRDAGPTLTEDVYGDAMTDVGLQGRLFRGVKRLLGRKDVRRLVVFDHPFSPVALVTPILLRIRKALVEAGAGAGGKLAAAGIGHPVNFEGRDRFRNQLGLSRLGEACRYAGVREAHFYPEPIAAAASFLHANADAGGEHVLTVDFGGGTLDLCVLARRPGNRFDVVTTHGVGLGGDHIDQRLFRELLFPLLGKGERWRRRGQTGDIDTLFPFENYEELLVNWPVTYMLNQNRYTTAVQDCIERGGGARDKFRRLRELIQQNYGYRVFQAIRGFKAELSSRDEAVLDIAEIDVEVRLTRTEFEALIADLLGQVEEAVTETLRRARLPEDAIDIVLRTGGSSLIPAVRRILDDRFPGRVVDHDPFTSVAAGLAVADYHGLTRRRSAERG